MSASLILTFDVCNVFVLLQKTKTKGGIRHRRQLALTLRLVCNNFHCAWWREEGLAALRVIGYGSVQMKYFIAVRFPAWTDRGVRSPNIY